MVKTDFGPSEAVSVRGDCGLQLPGQTGPQLEYRLDSNDEVEWIEMKGGDEPVQFEPPLVISAHHSHSLHTLHEKQNLRCWFEDMIDGRVAVDWENERVEISQFPAGFGFTIDSSFCSNPDVWWGEDYTFPKVADGGDGDGSVTPRKDVVDTVVKSAAMLGDKLADEDETCCRPDCGNPKLENVSSCEEHTLQKDEEGYVPLAGEIERESVSEYDFDFWKSEWGKVYEDYEEKTVVVEPDGAPPAAIEAIKNGVPSTIMVDVVGWIAEGDGYCNAKWCPTGTPDRDFCYGHTPEDPMWNCAFDTGSSEGIRMEDHSDTESKSLEGKLKEVADEIGQKRVEEMDERAVEYMRENRVFKAEITNVHFDSQNESVSFCLDIPTYNEDYYYKCNIHGEDEIGSRLNELMGYLGVNIRELHMVEGMYLPVAYGGDSGRVWEVFPTNQKSSSLMDKIWNFPVSHDADSVTFFAVALWVTFVAAFIFGGQYALVIWFLGGVLVVAAAVMVLPTRKDLEP